MITLITFQNVKNSNFLNYSPFCAKVELFLRFNGIEFKHVEHNGDLKKFPNQKLPVIIDAEVGNDMIADSGLIVEYLSKKFDIDMDAHLSESEKAISVAFKSLLEEHLYWAIVAERWAVDSNWLRIRDIFLRGAPKPIKIIIGGIIRKKTLGNLYGHGFGRFDEDVRFNEAAKLLKSLSDFLADKTFFHGDKVSSIDIIAYATITNILGTDLSPRLTAEANKYANFASYCESFAQALNDK